MTDIQTLKTQAKAFLDAVFAFFIAAVIVLVGAAISYAVAAGWYETALTVSAMLALGFGAVTAGAWYTDGRGDALAFARITLSVVLVGLLVGVILRVEVIDWLPDLAYLGAVILGSELLDREMDLVEFLQEVRLPDVR